MPVRPPITPGLRLLVISQDPAWVHAATAAAARLGAELDVLPDVGQALHWLLHIDRVCTHVLASGTLDTAQIDALAGMVDELTSLPTPLLLLGDAGLPSPDAQAIVEAVRAQPCRPHAERPVLAGPDLRAALHAGWLRMRFQPILAADTLAPMGLEALARLHHPALGILHPSEFLPQAVADGQERGFAGITAARTMLEAQALAQRGGASVLAGLKFGLNVTVNVFCQPYAVERARQLCDVAAVDTRGVVIELVETPTLPDLALLGDAVQGWRAAGFGVAIDDAGPALPHWRALLPLGFSSLKLDGRLGGDSNHLDQAAEITRAALAHGLYVIAEGIETEGALARMRDIGVSAVQGFLFARPLPALAVPIWLQEWARRPGT